MSGNIIGRKDDNLLSQGYVWAPYVISYGQPAIMESISSKRIRKIKKIIENAEKG